MVGALPDILMLPILIGHANRARTARHGAFGRALTMRDHRDLTDTLRAWLGAHRATLGA